MQNCKQRQRPLWRKRNWWIRQLLS